MKTWQVGDVRITQVIELTGLSPQFEHFDDANSAVRSFL